VRAMRRYILIFAVLLVVSGIMFGFIPGSRTHSDSTERPVPRESDQSTKNNSDRSLDCSGCHGPGKKLPYLGGDRFHVDAHNAYDHGFHARGIQDGKRSANCLDCHSRNEDMTTILPARDPRSTINRANIARTCGSCHGETSVMAGTGISNRPFVSYQESVHARAILHGSTKAAVCTDCHGSHDIRPASDDQSPIFKSKIPETCGQCHSNITAQYEKSVHGEAVARGVSRSPVCTDCHGIHSIKSHIDPTTATTSQALATGSCSQCHQGVALSQEFGVPSGRVSSYQDSYHGLASKLGSTLVANCASCHGVHNILPSSDPRSTINPANLVQTCGQCHPGASENFIVGKIHLDLPIAQDPGSLASRWVRRIYLSLIIVVIGGMVIHNGLILRKKAIAKRRAAVRTVTRMNLNQRIQHWALLLSFVVLVCSGFALKYPDSWLASLLGPNEGVRRIGHRFAAVVMMAVAVYHTSYMLLTAEGRQGLKDFLPKKQDLLDMLQTIRYYSGLGLNRPRIGRFGYAEKAEYWAVVWGTLIMSITGLMIWLKLGAFSFLPRWVVDVALQIHFYEAILATLAIIVWHLYNVIVDPDVYPLNWAVVDGKVSEEYFKDEHPLAYEEMIEAARQAQSTEKATKEDFGCQPSAPSVAD